MLSFASEIVGDFHELNAAGAPIADRLDPKGRPQFPVLVVVLVMIEHAIALQKTETAWIFINEGRDLQCVAIAGRAPDPFILAGRHLHPADVGDDRPYVVGAAMVERA